MAARLVDFGSCTAGGRVHRETTGAPETIHFTPHFSMTRDPRGHYAVEHAYVQYFVPADRNDAPAVVLVHGGGLSGSFWERTPDGRPGWLHGLLARGYEVHVIGNVERGRAGFAPGLWPHGPILRTMEEAWEIFRIGAPEKFATRRAFDGTRFPVHHLEGFARHFEPRWFSTTHLQVAALSDLFDRLDVPLAICHSQGSEAVYGALASGARLSGLIAVEPFRRPGNHKAPRPTALRAGGRRLPEPVHPLDTARHRLARAHRDAAPCGVSDLPHGTGRGAFSSTHVRQRPGRGARPRSRDAGDALTGLHLAENIPAGGTENSHGFSARLPPGVRSRNDCRDSPGTDANTDMIPT